MNEREEDRINVITLRKDGEKTLSRSMKGFDVYREREEFGLEVRL